MLSKSVQIKYFPYDDSEEKSNGRVVQLSLEENSYVNLRTRSNKRQSPGLAD